MFFHMEWTRPTGHRFDTLAFHISDYKNHRVLDNTNLTNYVDFSFCSSNCSKLIFSGTELVLI